MRHHWITAMLIVVMSASVSAAEVQTQMLQRCGLGSLFCAAYSPDGRTIVTGGGSGAYLWDIETSQVIRTFDGHTDAVISLAFSPDGTQILTASSGDTVKLWNAQTGEIIRTFTGHTDAVSSVAFSPDGTEVLTGSWDDTAKLWDAQTGDIIRTFTGHTEGVISVAFSPDGMQVLTGSGDNTAKLWNAETGAEIQTFTGHTYWIQSVAISPDGTQVLTGSLDNTARLWNAETGAEIQTFTGHTDWIHSVAFSPDGMQVLTGSLDNTAKLWNAQTGEIIRTFTGHSDNVHSVAFSPDGTQVLTGSWDSTAKLWDIATGVEIRTFIGHTAAVSSVAFSPDGTQVLTGSSDDTAELWDVVTGTLIRTFTGHTEGVNSVAFSPDGTQVLTGSLDNTAKLWDAQMGGLIRTFTGHTEGLNSVAFSPDGTQVLTGSWDNTAKLWDAATGDEIRTFTGHTLAVNSVAFIPDGMQVLTGSSDNSAKLWNAETGAETRSFTGHTDSVNSVAFSPNGTWVLTGAGDIDGSGNYTAKLWDAATGVEIRTFTGHTEGVSSVAFSPDGAQILTGAGFPDSTAKLWDAQTGEEIRTITGHTNRVASVAFSPDGTQVLTGSWDGTVRIWEINPPRAIIVAGGGDYPGNGIARQTDDLGAYAYRTLRARGYETADILYLSAFDPRDADGDGFDDVDDVSTLENLEEALTGEFAQTAGRLMILAMNHGYRTQTTASFRLNPSEVLLSTTLDGWLDDLQENHTVDLTLVIDACYSGLFVEDCEGAPPERQRIVLSSTSSSAEAIFMPPPDLTSFMHTFLSSAYMGNSIGEAWRAGSRFFGEFPVADQVPQISDGSGSTDNADQEFFGTTWAYGVQSTQDINRFFPVFNDAMEDTTIAPGAPIHLWVKMLPGQNPLGVTAVVRPPAPAVISGDPVSNLPHFALAQSATDERIWQATVNDVFEDIGPHVLSFTARFPYERVSNPIFRSVTISEGLDPDTTPIRAILGIGEVENPEFSNALEGLGPYAYRAYLDRFQDDEGIKQPDWIEYLTPFLVPDRDGTPSAQGVLDTIDALPLNIGRLYVHLIGDSSSVGSIGMASGDALTGAALDTALDNLQARQDCTVVLIVDAPGSGSFLSPCRATGDQTRIIITSGRENDAALFAPAPVLASFSHRFLAAAYQGTSLYDAHQSSRGFFQTFLNGDITPLLDDNGDGISDWFDGDEALGTFLGRRYAFAGGEASGLPFVLDAYFDSVTDPGQSATCTAQLISGIAPVRVFAQWRDPADTSSVIATLPEIEFTRDTPDGWTWSASVTAPSTGGQYPLAIYAEYADTPENSLSEPQFATLRVGALSDLILNHLLTGRDYAPALETNSDGVINAADLVTSLGL